MTSETIAMPAHVPSTRVVDVDVYAPPPEGSDFLLAWKAVQDSAPSSLIWTPRNEGHWIATRGLEIAMIYADHEAFSSRVVLVPRRFAEAHQVRPTTLDPPAHTPYRQMISAALTPSHVDAARGMMQETAAAAVARVAARGRCEYIAEVASALPLAVFLNMAGLPHTEAARLPRYNEPLIDADGQPTSADVMLRFAEYLRPHCAQRLAKPSDDLLGRIIGGHISGRPLDEDEAVELATTMMTGGIDTVISTLGLLMAHLARDPPLRERLACDPGLIPTAVRELLRRYPIMTKARLVTRRTDIDGVTLQPGDIVILPPLQGLDDRIFDNPLVVDTNRPPLPNLSFGAGVHRCPGMLLAIAEIETLLVEWLARIPDFVIDPTLPPRTTNGVLGAVQQLGLLWGAKRVRV